jgi:hypothetical protein
MPEASGAGGGGVAVKYAYRDQDTGHLLLTPPVRNQWYTILGADDVRLLLNSIFQSNDENAAKTLEVRWTCDSGTYLLTATCNSGTQYYISRQKYPSTDPNCLEAKDFSIAPMGRLLDKRSQSFVIEIRITDALGTNQVLEGWAVYETLDIT